MAVGCYSSSNENIAFDIEWIVALPIEEFFGKYVGNSFSLAGPVEGRVKCPRKRDCRTYIYD